ncbi:hypothetical protein KFE25_013806 [Diacronema lutheri]|uniref:dolichol kinase n=1 Tax=Diacronema lutheri TaxID=2081491 RepID=A0A8J5XJ91_DIALT|nr:hypothetical protein KFE25_013806 [Diacronema lutheri]
MRGEPVVVLLSAMAVAAAMRERLPALSVDAAALVAVAVCAALLDVRRGGAQNSAFGFRKGAGSGLSLGLTTVPCTLVAVLLSAPHGSAEDARLVRALLHASLASSSAVLYALARGSLNVRAAPFAQARVALVASALAALVFPATPTPLVLGASVATEPVVRLLLSRLRGSFSLGEAATVAQAAALLAVDVGLLLGCRGGALDGGALCARHDVVLVVAEVGLACALLLGPWLAAALAAADAHAARGGRARTRGVGGDEEGGAVVYAALGAFLVLVLYPALRVALGAPPVDWLCSFLLARPVRLALLGYWLALAAAGTALISAVRTRMPLILVRKLYHALAVLLFLPAMLVELQLMRLAFAVAIALLLALEYVRVARAPPLARPLSAFLRRYTDARDAGPLITTHIYLLLGCALPVLATPSAAPSIGQTAQPAVVLPPMAGILALGVGDSMASYVGVRFGRTRWPGTAKTVEGTAAAVGAIVVGAGALCAASAAVAPARGDRGDDASAALGVLGATIATCVLEAVTDQIDNLFLPLHYFCALRVALGAPVYGGVEARMSRPGE